MSICAPACENCEHTRQSHPNSLWTQDKQGGEDKLLTPQGEAEEPQKQSSQWRWLEMQVGTLPSWKHLMLGRKMHRVFTNSSSADSGPDMSRAGMKAIKWDVKKSLASWSRGHLRIHRIFCASQVPPWLSNWGDAFGNAYSSELLLTPIRIFFEDPNACSILAKNQEPFYCPHARRIRVADSLEGRHYPQRAPGTTQWLEPHGLQLYHQERR